MLFTTITSFTTALFALSVTAAPILDAGAPKSVDDPYGKGSFQLIDVAAGGDFYAYGGLWVTGVHSGAGMNNAVMTPNQSLATQFKYHHKTGDIYFNTKGTNTTTPYSLQLINSQVYQGPAGYNYVNINVGWAHSNFSFLQQNNYVELHWPGQIFAVCFSNLTAPYAPSPGLELMWHNGTVERDPYCLDVELKAVFNH